MESEASSRCRPSRWSLINFTLWVLGRRWVNRKTLQVLGGQWVHALQFRRECSSLLNRFWEFVGCSRWESTYRVLPAGVKTEVRKLLGILPLLVFDLRAPPHGVVTASDASETGGGVCRARGLTERGRDEVARREGRTGARGRDRVCLISLCDGIGGAKRALDLLGVETAAYASSEIDDTCRRVVCTAWP